MTDRAAIPSDPATARVKERVTLTDVAEHAGVSAAAASLALRGRPGVAEPTRQRVQESAAELGYRARAIERDELTIGLLTKARPHEVAETNAFYGPVMAGVAEAAATIGIDVRFDTLPVDEHYNPIEVPRLVDAPGIDGLLVLGAFLSAESARILDRLPLVLVDGYATDADRLGTVVTDNVGGARQATQRLIDLGHRHIVMAGSTPDAFPSILERRRGYVAAMHAARLKPRFVDGHHDEPNRVASAVAAALAGSAPFTGVVAANDDVAVAVIGELAGMVPAKVSVVGFDDIDAASRIRPGLDTIAVDKAAMGRVAVAMLMHRIRYPRDPAFTVVQPVHLVPRSSSAQPIRGL